MIPFLSELWDNFQVFPIFCSGIKDFRVHVDKSAPACNSTVPEQNNPRCKWREVAYVQR